MKNNNSNSNNNITINYENIDEYQPKVGVCFNIFFEEEDKTLAVHPFYWEDENTIEPDIVGGFNVYDEDGEFLGSCEDIDDIENFLYKDNNDDNEVGPSAGDTCNWHGENAHIIYIDEDECTLLVGDFSDDEVNEIITKFENDEDLGEIDDQIVWGTRDEFDEEQEY